MKSASNPKDAFVPGTYFVDGIPYLNVADPSAPPPAQVARDTPPAFPPPIPSAALDAKQVMAYVAATFGNEEDAIRAGLWVLANGAQHEKTRLSALSVLATYRLTKPIQSYEVGITGRRSASVMSEMELLMLATAARSPITVDAEVATDGSAA